MEKTVLIVDDERGIRNVLKICLEDMGYLVQEAESGNEALQILEKKRFDIVLTDIRMPGMSGISLLKKIKEKTPETEVVMVTGHGDLKTAIESMKADAVDFINKPIDRDILEIAIKRANDRIDAKKQIKHYTDNLETLVREKASQLADLGLHISSVSHSLKQVLTGFDGGAYLMESGLTNKNFDRITEGWSMIKDKLFQARTMILEILQHSKKRPLEKKEISIKEFARNVCRNIQALADQHHIELILMVGENATTAFMDKNVMFNALTAILENAVDAVKPISGRTGQIRFSVEQSGSEVIFKIRDNGKGIAKDKLEKIFDLFYSEKGAQGTGLGLFIAARSVEQHNGTIRVDSKEDSFTEFTITLPMM